MEYIRISFSTSRRVIINGKTCGMTNTALQIAAGQLHVMLQGDADFEPAGGVRIRVRPGETNVLAPKLIEFSEACPEQSLLSFREDADPITNGIADRIADGIVDEIGTGVTQAVVQQIITEAVEQASQGSGRAGIKNKDGTAIPDKLVVEAVEQIVERLADGRAMRASSKRSPAAKKASTQPSKPAAKGAAGKAPQATKSAPKVKTATPTKKAAAKKAASKPVKNRAPKAAV